MTTKNKTRAKTRKAKPTPAPEAPKHVTVRPEVQAEVSTWIAAVKSMLADIFDSADFISGAIENDPTGELAAAFNDDGSHVKRVACFVEQAEMAIGSIRTPWGASLPDPVAVARGERHAP